MVTKFLLSYYERMQRLYPALLWRGDASRREVALTFDDGPHPRDTRRVLEVLGKHQVRGTFHLVGRHAEQHPGLVQQIYAGGHQPALHGYRHVPFPLERPSTLRAQLDHTRTLIEELCGHSPETVRDVRPPYGAFNKHVLAHVSAWGYRLVMWTCLPPHWMQPLDWSINQIMEAVLPGTVIVLHDGHGHGKRVAEIVDRIVPRIRSLGYQFVTEAEMQTQRAGLRLLT